MTWSDTSSVINRRRAKAQTRMLAAAGCALYLGSPESQLDQVIHTYTYI